MSSPAYHLRSNKAADRFALLEAIRRLPMLDGGDLQGYTYFGLGGPYLEDFRLLYDVFPDIRMVSIEREERVYRRQEFHRPCRTLKLVWDDMSSYIARYDPGADKCIFWLDYTGLEYSYVQDFQALLGTVADNSMVKITLRSDPRDYWTLGPPRMKKKARRFRTKFESVMLDPSVPPPKLAKNLAYFLQEMLQVATEQVLPPTASSRTFVPVSSFYYSDGTWMFTLTGIVCEIAGRQDVERAFADWAFANLEWGQPKKIAVPVLSTKERLHLQRLLPTTATPGKTLRKGLGYLTENDAQRTEEALEQYAAFHRYSPYFIRGVP